MYLAFDIETFPGDDGRTEVSCIGAVWEQDSLEFPTNQQVWFGEPEMKSIEDFILFLHSKVYYDNYTIATWNGLGYDFRILAERFPEDFAMIKKLAFSDCHIDPMFQFHCSKGFPVGLSAVASGLRLQGKTEGMDGLKASEMWVEGSPEDRQRVLAYVVQDARATLDVVKEIDAGGKITWITKKGYAKTLNLPLQKLLPVTECVKIPEPDVSWMTEPMLREEFYKWTMETQT